MAEGRRLPEVEEEDLPSLASLLQLLVPLGSSSAVVSAERAVEKVVLSSGSEKEEDEVVEIVPLSERIKRRVEGKREAVSEPPQSGSGSAVRRDGLHVIGGLLAPGREGLRDAMGASGDGSSGSQNDTDSAQMALCPLPASQCDSTDRPSRPLISEASPGTSPAPKKSKYTQKEKEAMCQAAWQRRKEREARKKQQEEEKERKRARAKMLKAQRPGECEKYMKVELDAVLLQVHGGAHILNALQAANYSCVVVNQAAPCSITWQRKNLSLQMGKGDEWTEEPNILVVLRLEGFLSMVQNYKQEAKGCAEEQKHTLESYINHVMEKMPGKIPTLAVAGVETHFRSLAANSKKRQRQSAMSEEEELRKQRKGKVTDYGLEITRLHVEEALVDLQLSKQVQVRLFESWEELGEYTMMLTKAIAQAPFKKEQENTGFSFYFEKGWRGGVKVDPSGKGLLEVWKRQIQQFNRVSLEMAEAIVSAYPSPQLLVQGFNRCSSEQERQNMLANILVHRGEGVTATSRRIGPELSRRIYLQMTSLDPDLYLDSTG